MEFLTPLFNVIQAWGPSATSAVLVVVVSHLAKRIDADAKKGDQRIKDLRDYIDGVLTGFGERLSAVEKDYVKMEFFLRELSGWRSEINRVLDHINDLSKTFSQNFFQLLNSGKFEGKK